MLSATTALGRRATRYGVLRDACRALSAATTAAAEIPVLSAEQALAASRERRAAMSTSHLVAMYSSYHGGILTDPALMALPVDDHMANRGHGMCALPTPTPPHPRPAPR